MNQNLDTIKRMLAARDIDILQDGLEIPERQDVKRAYYNYHRALRENKAKSFVKRAHDACITAIAAFDKTQSKNNRLETLLG